MCSFAYYANRIFGFFAVIVILIFALFITLVSPFLEADRHTSYMLGELK